MTAQLVSANKALLIIFGVLMVLGLFDPDGDKSALLYFIILALPLAAAIWYAKKPGSVALRLTALALNGLFSLVAAAMAVMVLIYGIGFLPGVLLLAPTFFNTYALWGVRRQPIEA